MRKEQVLHLLRHLLFLLKLTGKYLAVFVYLFLLTILETIRMTMFLLEAIYSVVVLAQLLKLICVDFLFARINLSSFLNDGDSTLFLLFNFIYNCSVIQIKSFHCWFEFRQIKSST